MMDFKLLTRQLLETYLGSDTLSDVAIQDFLDSNASIIGTGKQEFFKNIEHFLNSFKFDVEKRKNIHFEFKDLEIEENIVDDQCVFVYGSVQIYGLYDKEVTIIHLDSRFTIIYGVRDGKWKVLHIHHSIPDKEQLEDEEFPITLGKQVQQARHEVEALSAGYSYICLINLETGDVELIKGNNIPGLNGRYTQMDQNILLEQVNRLIAKPFRQSSVEFYDSKTIAKRLEGKNSLFHTCERTDGTWILSMIVPQKYDENGRVVSVLLANRDFTEEKKRELEQEEALRQEKVKAEKANEAKSIFLFNMSHDIRTPMNAIVGYSQLMKKELTNPKLIHYQEMIEQSSKLLLSIINNVLDMARVESGKMELDENYEVIGNISQLVCSAFAAEASRKNIELNIIVNVEHKHIIVDSTKMQEILSNLISNAIKYTSAGGKVTIDTKELPYDKEGYVLIQTKVTDTGIGMSEEFLPSLFELFTRERNTTLSKIPGTGLGMAIVKNFVDLMNGSIEVESELGKGSTFTITIPHKIANKDYTNRNIKDSNECDINFMGKRILLAEDNELNAEITTTILSEMGFEVKAVEDGILCVNEIQHQPANTYDLILMDIQMPNMDGYKATHCIRRLLQPEKSNIPIIAMSANAFEEDKKKAFDVKMNDYITKPIDFQKMEEVLKHILSK
ncbi:ATP-binding protein [Holdemanella biformis]|uniref:ATP-binding protein n=1 Tax=Holdemanella biformis TaxID=1735 RepID=UPI00266FCEA2|nr:ATP-binding protein [Holdemanella biformis]